MLYKESHAYQQIQMYPKKQAQYWQNNYHFYFIVFFLNSWLQYHKFCFTLLETFNIWTWYVKANTLLL